MPQFCHLHCHTQYSLLDGASNIKKMVQKAKNDNQTAIAISDHGNMFGAFQFVNECIDNGIKPIVGCEFYMVENRHQKIFTKEQTDHRYHQILLAKNYKGYQNLCRLSSLGFIDGYYSKYPRIDKSIILQYHEGLIATTCCLGAEIPQAILNNDLEKAETLFKWWLDLFGDDFYVELQRHSISDQDKVNAFLIKLAKQYQVKIIATNDSHYLEKSDAYAHEILLCINTGEKFSTEKGYGKGKRFAFENDEFYFKTTSEMEALFIDIPEALDYTNEIASKVEQYQLKRNILLPEFPLPEGFSDINDYLEHLTIIGAKQKYGHYDHEVKVRCEYELGVIKRMGFAGYFLIVSDFCVTAKEMSVVVGPGRGSAAGSAVAYCLNITNIDPIKYKLLFERFLNPSRNSMPDIDTDFDDYGRSKVIDYVVNKYGNDKVAQIITYGSMKTKTSIKDVARVLELPLSESDKLTKLVPDRNNPDFNIILELTEKQLKEKEFRDDEIVDILQLRTIAEGNDLAAKVLQEAKLLEGSVRNVGIHAAGIIIAPQNLMDLIPVATVKDTNSLVTQYEGKVIEDAGLLKMDFLGLKTLTIIKDALEMVEENYGIKIIPDLIPLDDLKTFELLQRGETVAIFQFESPGMQKYLIDLKPDKIEDLIAMNALYRPGPIAYIPEFIKRKLGQSKIEYDLEGMEEFLEETYGITVYQEQVMLLSQKIGGFDGGEADNLRKAMGKKQKEVLDKMKKTFLEGGTKNNHPKDKLEKVWTDWEAFAQYAFNKSHSTCYAFIALQTAYLKANYPAEFMAANLTNNDHNIEQITFLMDECRRMGINVLGPDINESMVNFTATKKGDIRFGLGGIKGIGEAATNEIINQRKAKGTFNDIFDLVTKVNLRTVNKKGLEALAQAGAFDTVNPDIHRAQYIDKQNDNEENGIEKILKYAQNMAINTKSQQTSLFGDSQSSTTHLPKLPLLQEWSLLEKLRKEKDVVGMYISGHPLDNFKFEIKHFCNSDFAQLQNLNQIIGKDLKMAGIVISSEERLTKNGKPFGFIHVEDYMGTYKFALFGEDYSKFAMYGIIGSSIYILAKVQPKYYNPNEMELKIKKIQYLEDLKSESIKSLTLKLEANSISNLFVDELFDCFNKSNGNTNLKFQIVDSESNSNVIMFSKKIKCTWDDGIETLLKKYNLNYTLN